MTVGEHNLALLAEQAFEKKGDYEALWFEGRWYRSGEVFDRSCRLAQGLVELGVAPGDRVCVFMANGPDVGVVYTALWRAGAVVMPVIFLVPPPDLQRMLIDAEATAIVTTPEFLFNVRQAAEGVPSLKWIITTGPEDDGAVSVESLVTAEPGPIVPRADSDLAALMYTGGTTGRSKGVMLAHENLWWCGKSSQEASFVPGISRSLVPIPLSHAFGLIVTIVALHNPEPQQAWLMRWFDPAGWLQLASEHKVQQSTVVPSMLQLLLGQPLEEHDLSSLRFVISGASPLPLDVAEEFMRRVPGVKIREGYGCTESGAVISTAPPDAIKLGTVGKPIPGYEVRLLDDDGNEVPQGELGEVCVRARGVMQGYWRDEEATAEALRDGWLHTGDIGRFDEDGYLSIVDRKKDLIIRGGFNVFPRDVEEVLVEHPAVALAGVVGRPDKVHGEEVVAFVSLHPGAQATPEELIEFCKERLNRYKYPREIHVVDMVPLTPVGKIDRKVLRARAADAAAQG